MPPLRLLDQVRASLRRQHYAYTTERSYVDWIKRFILRNMPGELDTRDERLGSLGWHISW